MKALIAFLALTSFAPALAVVCFNRTDGIYEIGCVAYTICSGGQRVIKNCNTGEVFDITRKVCDLPTKVPPPCGIFKDCSKLRNRKYPDVDNKCRSYFTCYSGQFMGHNPCPGDLVFNDILQACDFAYRVLPPCGTKKS